VNANEAIMLCRFVKAACPQQAIDEYTPDAWLILLEPFRYEDCKQAAVELARAEPFFPRIPDDTDPLVETEGDVA
jgi:hypothetical protein